MNTKLSAQSVTVRREIPACAEDLFDAWLDADSLAIWMCPGNVTHSVARLDARPGGRFEIEMHTPDAVLRHHGTYRTVERPHRLVFTWVSGGTQQTESLVTVDFHRTRGGTEIVLLHEQLPNDAAAHAHGMGWNRIVDLLLSLVEGRHRTPTH